MLNLAKENQSEPDSMWSGKMLSEVEENRSKVPSGKKDEYYFNLEIEMKFLAMEGAMLQNSYPGGAGTKPVWKSIQHVKGFVGVFLTLENHLKINLKNQGRT